MLVPWNRFFQHQDRPTQATGRVAADDDQRTPRLAPFLKPGGYVAFEVGEVRNGTLLLEELILPAGVEAELEPVIIMVNVQEFTKTANAWGVDNRTKGTNTNSVVFQKEEPK